MTTRPGCHFACKPAIPKQPKPASSRHPAFPRSRFYITGLLCKLLAGTNFSTARQSHHKPTRPPPDRGLPAQDQQGRLRRPAWVGRLGGSQILFQDFIHFWMFVLFRTNRRDTNKIKKGTIIQIKGNAAPINDTSSR